MLLANLPTLKETLKEILQAESKSPEMVFQIRMGKQIATVKGNCVILKDSVSPHFPP